MRSIFSLAVALAFGPALATASHADPYRWCAEYSGGAHGGSTSCYFMTFAQCQASVSGVGGFCRENPFFDGQPIRTPEDPPRAPRRKRS